MLFSFKKCKFSHKKYTLMIINAKNEKFQFYWNQLYNDFPEAPSHFQLSIMKFIGQRPIDENYKTENLSFIVFFNIQDKPVAGVYIFHVEKDKNINVSQGYSK